MILGNASEIDAQTLKEEYSKILCGSETILKAYKFIRDKVVLTDKRIIIQNTQGVTGSKREYLSVPYRSVIRFSVETAGTLDMDSELKIWTSGGCAPVEIKFGRSEGIYVVQKIIAENTVC